VCCWCWWSTSTKASWKPWRFSTKVFCVPWEKTEKMVEPKKAKYKSCF
jgi:hypothetical protein